MARDRQDGIYVDKPSGDIYLVLMILTFIATLIAVIILYVENASLAG